MPLLKKKTLEKAQVDEFLRDDEEVFHCVMTNEIFRDYDEFAERTILCNSMVWSCSMTGKSNLTYEEALESEENAKKVLNGFPTELRIPLLYIANYTKRTLFGEMADDVFLFINNHFFIGEKVSLKMIKDKEYFVLGVISPTAAEIEAVKKKSKENETQIQLVAPLYKYEIQLIDDSNPEKNKLIADYSELQRRSTYTREISKLFLKQYVEQNGTHIGIKQLALKSFGIETIKFSQIFVGEPPIFEAKKGKNGTTNGKKVRQETLAKFLSKNHIADVKSENEQAKIEAKLKAKQEKVQEREKRVEEKKEQREQIKVEINLKLRDWYIPKDDLFLEDHKILPELKPIKSKIPDKFMGDVFCLMEFVKTFSSIIGARNFFSAGVSLATMERVLFDTKAASLMNDFVQMLLQSLFKLEAKEKENYGKYVKQPLSMCMDGSAMADRCQIFAKKCFGCRVSELPVDVLTVSEILRLHLLSSGDHVNENGVKWRAQYRGAYASEEDPAIEFRKHNPHILKALALHNVCQLPMADKLKVLDCLMNQLLSLKEFRDFTEDKLEETRSIKLEIRKIRGIEIKRLAEVEQQISLLKQGAVSINEAPSEKLIKIRKESEKLKNDHDFDIEKLRDKLSKNINMLGMDRAYRYYIKLGSVPGLLINHEDPNVGTCLPDLIQHIPELFGANRVQIRKYLFKVAEEMNTSDKENEPKENHVAANESSLPATLSKLLMCSTDPTTCSVHSASHIPHKWFYISNSDILAELTQSLNNRGIFEGRLKTNLEMDQLILSRLIGRTPSYLEDTSTILPPRFQKQENLGYPEGHTATETLRLGIVESIMELEDKLFAGYLGGILKDRDEFRQLISDNSIRNTDKLSRPRPKWIVDYEESSEWEDPAVYLNKYKGDIDSEDSDIDSDEVLLMQTSADRDTIKFLSHGLLQIAFSIKPNFLSAPLGKRSTKGKLETRCNCFWFWEQNLICATSYSQLFLHYSILNNCINWSKSTEVVKCKKCHRGTDDVNILLCDFCNDGYHLYCLKPKLLAVPEDEWYCMNCADEHQRIEPSKDCAICEKTADENVVQCTRCANVTHSECANLKRARTWTCNHCKDKSPELDDSLEETFDDSFDEQTYRRSARHNKESNDRNSLPNEELPLNNAAWQELLRDVMKHQDAWPFIRPVPKHEVPDYHQIITTPMDFGTIKYKLNMGDYQYDDEVILDCQLVFENCRTYNDSEDDVFHCGTRLSTFFMKKATGMKLIFDDQISSTKRRATSDSSSVPSKRSRR